MNFIRQPDVKMSKSILRTLQKTRSAQIPKAPKSGVEITQMFHVESIQEKFGKTMRKDENHRTEFFKGAVDSEKGFSFCVFASEDVIKAIENVPENNRKLFADGTFAVRNKFYFECTWA